MKRFLLSLLTLALAAALAAFALTPVVVRQTRLWQNAKAVSGYRDAVDRLSPRECDDLLAQARARNPADPDSGVGGDAYAALLNPAGDGTMAVLEIPKAGVVLAVTHGGDSNDAARVAHVPQSPLPCTGANGPCLLQATRERFYDPLAGLDRLMAGDCFFLQVLQETWTYEVVQVARETPETPVEGNAGPDECVLVAATPGGAGEARLVVRGRRVNRRNVDPRDDSRLLPGGTTELILAAPIAVAGLVLLVLIEGIRRAAQRHRRRRMKL